MLVTLKSLQNSPVRGQVEERLAEFQEFKHKPTQEWFSELCFCLLTANSKADSAIAIQEELGAQGFCEFAAEEVKRCIMKHKHRFHNNKTSFIMGAREHIDIKQRLSGMQDREAREWLVKNIKGLGYKEASHFLRNVGYTNVAIIDRHILRAMADHKMIDEIPKSITPRVYAEFEQRLKNLADKLKISLAELDLYIWYSRTGRVLK